MNAIMVKEQRRLLRNSRYATEAEDWGMCRELPTELRRSKA